MTLTLADLVLAHEEALRYMQRFLAREEGHERWQAFEDVEMETAGRVEL